MLEDAQQFPRIFGHEAAGIVESVGEGVTDLKEGDHGIPLFAGEFGDCVYCKSKKTNICGIFRVDTFRTMMQSVNKSHFSISGKPVYHFMTSTFSEYTVIDYACAVKINPKVPLKKVSLLSCGIATGVGWIGDLPTFIEAPILYFKIHLLLCIVLLCGREVLDLYCMLWLVI